MTTVVIGAGIVGLACAYELARAGRQVAVLDANGVGSGASFANAGKVAVAECGPVPAPGMVLSALKWMMRPDSPVYIRPTTSISRLSFLVAMGRNCTAGKFKAGLRANLALAQLANDIMDEWADGGVRYATQERGVLLAFEREQSAKARLKYSSIFDAAGVQGFHLGPSDVRSVEPALSSAIRHGIYYPSDRQVDPARLNRALQDRLTHIGAAVTGGHRVTGFRRQGTRVSHVLTDGGLTVPCDAVVIAAGYESARLTRALGWRFPLQPGKGYSVDFAPTPLALRTSLTLEDAHVAVTPLGSSLRLAGTMEFAGANLDVNRRRVQAIVAAAQSAFDGWNPLPEARQQPWAGLRPMTPDGVPVIDVIEPFTNAYVATGHGMLGLTQAPATARLIRDLVGGARAETSAYRLARFGRRDRVTVAEAPRPIREDGNTA